MAIDLERYRKLKETVDRYRRETDRADGALRQVMGELEEEHGCKTIKAAERKLKTMEAEADEAEREYRERLEEFEAEWGDRLGGGR